MSSIAPASARSILAAAVDAWGPLYDSDREINGGDLVEWLGEFLPAARAALAAPPPIVGITIEGGVLADIVTTDPATLAGVRFLVIDYDTDDAEMPDLSLVVDPGGQISTAYVGGRSATEATIDLRALADEPVGVSWTAVATALKLPRDGDMWQVAGGKVTDSAMDAVADALDYRQFGIDADAYDVLSYLLQGM